METNITKKAAVLSAEEQAERKAKSQRVRLVRRLSKWAAKLDGVASNAVTLRRDGVTIPDGWTFEYAPFLSLVNACRAYVGEAIASATTCGRAESEV